MSFFSTEAEKQTDISEQPVSDSDLQSSMDMTVPSTPTSALSLEPPAPVTVERPRLSSHNALWRDAMEILVLIVTIYTLVNLATARAIVEGDSMQPNFQPKQLIIVNRFVYYFGEPHRGDVIVLHNPKNPNEDFIKRLIGLPGETVVIKEGRVYINDRLLDEPYIPKFCTAGCDGTWTIEPDNYFVLGDNRSNSYDSHMFGTINRDLIVGQAWIRYWPPQNMGMIPHPGYLNLTGQYTAPSQTEPPTATPEPTKPDHPSQISPLPGNGI